jgi:plastocyanin
MTIWWSSMQRACKGSLTMLLRKHLAAVALILVLPVTAVHADDVYTVEMIDYRYKPQSLEIPVGSTVRWVNGERRTSHDVYFPDKDVGSPRLFPEEYWEHRFDSPGEFPYYCRPHEERNMRGVIRVVPASGSAAGAPDTDEMVQRDFGGYGDLRFGMSVDEVLAKLSGHQIDFSEAYETSDGDLIIDGRVSADAEKRGGLASPGTDLRFVFPAQHQQLALVLEFHPEADLLDAVQARLASALGEPWAEELAGQVFERLKDTMPAGVEDLIIWGGGEQSRQHLVRLWVYDDYLSVEYLDLGLL